MKKTLLLLVALIALTATARHREVKIRIVQTTDIHGNYLPYDFIAREAGPGGLSRVAAYVREQRREVGADHLLLLDNGDILQGQPTAYYYNFIDTASTHLCAAALNHMDYVCGTVGNHDIEAGHAVYDRWIAQCNFPVLGANIISTDTGNTYLPPYVVREVEGVRVAILGMITPGIPTWLPENLWSGLTFADMVQTARRWMPVLKEQERADVVIGLFHSGVGDENATGALNENAALQVAREVPGFDLVLCGHDHRQANRTIVNADGDSVLVLNPAANGMAVAVANVTVRVGEQGVESKRVEGGLADVANIEPDADFCATFSRQFDEVRAFTNEVIGRNKRRLNTREAYFGPSAFIDFIHTLQLKISGADISFAAPLSFDAEIPEGDIRVSDMFNLYKYENLLYVMTLTGREVKNYLERSYGGWTAQMQSAADHLLLFSAGAETLADPWQRLKTPSYNFDSAAGIIYTVDVTKPEGQKITIERMADGRPFSLDATYRVAVNSYRGNGGGGLLTEGAGLSKDELLKRIVWSTDKDLRYYLMQAIRESQVIDAKPLDQWRFVPEDWARQAAERDAEILFRR